MNKNKFDMQPPPAPEVSWVGRHVTVADWRQTPNVRNAEPRENENFHPE
jgi:hypothetical protein